MKKKSPPYAIIMAALLGIVAIVALVMHEKKVKADNDQAILNAQAAAQAQIDAANKSKGAVVTEVPTNMRAVLYATQPVEAGVRMSAAFFETKQTPIDILPDAYTDKTDIVGWFATRRIEKGDPLTPRNVGKSLPMLSMRITPGMRAITLPIFNAELNDTGGFVVDGDRVDLLGTRKSEDEKYEYNTQTVMQNVNVLFVPGPPTKTEKTDGVNPVPSAGPIGITFEVTPEQAQMLVFLAVDKNLKLTMILRSRRDTSEISVKPFNAEDYDFLNLKKVQKTIDKSIIRVNQLSDEIAAKEKADSATQGTNETTNPTPPTP